jgi:cell division GTPase FtsZ
MSVEIKTENLEVNVIDNLPKTIGEVKNENKALEDEQAKKIAEMKALMKKKSTKDKIQEIYPERKKKSLKFGIIGTGQCGSRLAVASWNLGYPSIALNTAPQDLDAIELPEENKYLLSYGIGGAAKDMAIGAAAAETYREQISNLVNDKLADTDILILASSLGGGSGAGSLETIIDILSATEKPIMVMTVLPLTNEDQLTKSNSLNSLAKLSKLVQQNVISNIIVIDNAKLENAYSNISHLEFFPTANRVVWETLEAFNYYSANTSLDKPLDSLEYARLLVDGAGYTIWGSMQVSDYSTDAMAIAKAVVENWDNGLLASGFDVSQAKYAGVIIVANSNVWKEIPRGSLDLCTELIRDNCGGSEALFKGVYVDDSITDNIVKVYSMVSGLGLPTSRIEQLKKEVQIETQRTKERAKARDVNLNLQTNTEDTVSKAQEIREKIMKGSSKFSKAFGIGSDLERNNR